MRLRIGDETLACATSGSSPEYQGSDILLVLHGNIVCPNNYGLPCSKQFLSGYKCHLNNPDGLYELLRCEHRRLDVDTHYNNDRCEYPIPRPPFYAARPFCTYVNVPEHGNNILKPARCYWACHRILVIFKSLAQGLMLSFDTVNHILGY